MIYFIKIDCFLTWIGFQNRCFPLDFIRKYICASQSRNGCDGTWHVSRKHFQNESPLNRQIIYKIWILSECGLFCPPKQTPWLGEHGVILARSVETIVFNTGGIVLRGTGGVFQEILGLFKSVRSVWDLFEICVSVSFWHIIPQVMGNKQAAFTEDQLEDYQVSFSSITSW